MLYKVIRYIIERSYHVKILYFLWLICMAEAIVQREHLNQPLPHIALSNTSIIVGICHVCLLHLLCPSISEHVLENVIITTILEIRVEITDRLVWQDCLRAKSHSHSKETRLSFIPTINATLHMRVPNTV